MMVNNLVNIQLFFSILACSISSFSSNQAKYALFKVSNDKRSNVVRTSSSDDNSFLVMK